MINIQDKKMCSGCSACALACPLKCIAMVSDDEGFLYPRVDTALCIDCGICEKKCSLINKIKKEEGDPTAFAAYSKDRETRLNSSSGGVFTEIAKQVIKNGGVVFGAALDENLAVVHKGVEAESDLKLLRGSKYAQSKIGDAYLRAESFLKEGRTVLFSGTPCQIGGLIAYIGKPYDNLITQDISCHGVPSPAIWSKYVKERESAAKSKAKRAEFRNKKYGWRTYSVLFEFENNKKYSQLSEDDLYMRAFLNNICLRPSCYDCGFKDKIRDADITLADFWGIQNVAPDMDDNSGTSLVLVNTEKGRALFDSAESSIVRKEVDFDVAISYNPAITKSSGEHKERDRFMKELQNGASLNILNKYCKMSISRKFKQKIKHILRRIKIDKVLLKK